MPEQAISLSFEQVIHGHSSLIEGQPWGLLNSEKQTEKSAFPYAHNPQTKFFDLSLTETGTSHAHTPNKRFKNQSTIPVELKDYTEDLKQIWDGTVISFNEDTIKIRLEDKITLENPETIVDLSIDEVSSQDRPLIKEGAMLFWYIGYREGNKHPRERFSKICFRRRLGWTDKEIEDANTIAKEYENFFINNSSQPA